MEFHTDTDIRISFHTDTDIRFSIIQDGVPCAGEMDGCWLCLCDKCDCWFLLAPRDSCGSGDLSEIDGFWIEREGGRSTKVSLPHSISSLDRPPCSQIRSSAARQVKQTGLRFAKNQSDDSRFFGNSGMNNERRLSDCEPNERRALAEFFSHGCD